MEKLDEFTPEVIGRLMKQIEFFNEFNEEEIKFVLNYMDDFVRYQADESVIKEGAVDDSSMFVMLSGRCVVSSGKDRVFLDEIKVGEFFGEISFFNLHGRTADVTSTEVAILWKISHALIEEATLELKNKIYQKIIRKLTKILMHSNQQVTKSLV